MRRLAELVSLLAKPGQDRAALLAAHLPLEPSAMQVLCAPVPPRLITPALLRQWIADETGTPPWLVDASRAVTGDLTEALALLLPHPAPGPEPTLTEVLTDLSGLPPGPLARPAILSMARRLPPDARALYFRLITGTFRAPVSTALLDEVARLQSNTPAAPLNPAYETLAVMIYAEAALTTGARGPEITLAVWSNGSLVPIARARPSLPTTQTTALMDWIRAEATSRFGPLRAVPARQVFSVRFTSLIPNRRRKSGFTLDNPQITAWHPDRDPTEAAQLGALTALLPNTP